MCEPHYSTVTALLDRLRQGSGKLAAKLYRIIHACKFFIHCCFVV